MRHGVTDIMLQCLLYWAAPGYSSRTCSEAVGEDVGTEYHILQEGGRYVS